MGTRGSFGFRIDGEDKLAYNHYDSYPEGLGFDLIVELRDLLKGKGGKFLKDAARGIEGVTDPPRRADTKRWAPYLRSDVGAKIAPDGKLDKSVNWYQLTREAQGKLWPYLELGQMELHEGEFAGNLFLNDSLFCEWAYIVNLDTRRFEVYEGFNQDPRGNQGRYVEAATTHDRGYWPVRLVGEIPFEALIHDVPAKLLFEDYTEALREGEE